MSSKDLNSIRDKGLESRQLQGRIRHLQFVIGRNINPLMPITSKVKERVNNFSLYFTLHPGKDTTQVLYQSEEIQNSVNPNWKEFYPKLFRDQRSCMATSCTLCVWAVQNGKSKLMIRWNVDFSGLRYIGDQQRPLNSQILDPNTLVFGMFKGYYTLKKEQKPEGDTGEENNVFGALLKVQQSTVKWTYQKNSLLRVHYMLKALYETKQQVVKIQEDMHKKTIEREILSGKFTEKESLVSRIAMLREELSIQREHLCSVSKQMTSKSQTVKEREKDLSQRYDFMEQHVSGLKAFHSAHIVRRESLLKVGAQLDFRRRQLVAELSYIYPIIEFLEAIVENSQRFKPLFFIDTICRRAGIVYISMIPGKEYGKRDLAISDIRLPDTEDFFGEDEDTLSVAIGNTCHLVSMVAKFLELPLRYPLRPMGSRSTVLDLVTDKLYGKLEREFPLHAKAKEKFLFHYGLFLLNKNIGQLRYHNGIGTTDLRKTLPNLKHLFENKFGVKVVYKKDTELLPHGYARQTISRKGTGSSLNSLPLSSSPKQNIDVITKPLSINESNGTPKRKSKKDSRGDKKESGLPSVQKHSQVHKFINRRGKKGLSKTYSAPDSSSSDNLMEIPFEDLLMRSNRSRTKTLNEAEAKEDHQTPDDVTSTGIPVNYDVDTELSVHDGLENSNGLDHGRDEDLQIIRTITAFDAMSPFEEVSDTPSNHVDEDDISCIVDENSVAASQVVLEEENLEYTGYTRQLSDVLVIPEPFEIDHGIQHLQSQLGNRI